MKQITKSYLEYLGITEITTDGRIFTKNGERKPSLEGKSKNNPSSQAKPTLKFHDPNKYKRIPKEKRTDNSGHVSIRVSHIVYAWFNKEVPYGKEIHHIDLNYLNNSKDNLEALTPEEHRAKHASTRELECRLDRPREYYEKKLAEYKAIENKTRTDHNSISNYKARLRYYDNHLEEAYQAQKDKRDLEMIKHLAQEAKNSSDLIKWHQLNDIAKNWKTYDSELKEQLIQVILKGHTFNV